MVDSFAQSQSCFIDESPSFRRDILARGIKNAKNDTARKKVQLSSGTTTVRKAMQCIEEGREKPKNDEEVQFVIHPDWPWHVTGENQLLARMRSTIPDHSENSKRRRLALWRLVFWSEIVKVFQSGQHCILVCDPNSPLEYIETRKEIPTYETIYVKGDATGAMKEIELCRLLLENLFSIEDVMRFSGATYAACPSTFSLYLTAALQYGVLLPYMGTNKEFVDQFMHQMRDVNALDISHNRLGTLMDCEGVMKNHAIFPERSWLSTKITDEKTIVVPDTVASLT